TQEDMAKTATMGRKSSSGIAIPPEIRSEGRTAAARPTPPPMPREQMTQPWLGDRWDGSSGPGANGGSGGLAVPRGNSGVYALKDGKAPAARQAPVTPPPPAEKPEVTGEGVLFPALVIGLGGQGLGVLQHLRAALHKRCGSAAVLPHIRLLEIDTDPDALQELSRGDPEAKVTEEEVLLARLQRPAHYMKPGREQQAICGWLPKSRLTRLPREQVTPDGTRTLGRLGFAIHYSAIAGRIRAEIQACTDPQLLQTAQNKTGLALRTNRPRVYVVASLAGGTGSGMFLDLAYTVRRLLRNAGYAQAEIVGLFLLPEDGDVATRAAGNVVAALTELNHFAAPGSVFSAAYLHQEETLVERGPAFSRCILLPVDADQGAAPVGELTALAGDFLCRDLTTSVGRMADQCRQQAGGPSGGLAFQTFGTFWFTVPHRLMLQRVAQRFCHDLVKGWQNQTAATWEQAIGKWIQAQFERWQLGAQVLLDGLNSACAATLEQAPLEVCSSMLADWSEGGDNDLGRNPGAVKKALKEIEHFVGWPGTNDVEEPIVLREALAGAAEIVAQEALNRLADVALSALSDPRFRLAVGAGDAVQREIYTYLGELAKQQQSAALQQDRRAADLERRFVPLLEQLRKRSLLRWGHRARTAAEMVELFNQFLTARCQALFFEQLSSLYQHLRDNLHKHQREVNCCRPKLAQFVQSFEEVASRHGHVDLGLGQYLLPPGCKSLDEGAAHVLSRLTAEERAELRQQTEALLARRFQQQIHVCTAPSTFFKELQEEIYKLVAAVTEAQLMKGHAAEIYVQQHGADQSVLADLGGAYEEAAPELTALGATAAHEISILAVPPGPEGEYFRSLVHQALPDKRFVDAASTDDIVFYREYPQLSLADLPQMGAPARQAYQQLLNGENTSPHSRADIAAWHSI
ncbi:MAG TPA: tubulin-like doman-containing protein, partial [Gemmataceae bacterium]|nr:tubulin-like doman-containing protein [Gemmataceae bacterium]